MKKFINYCMTSVLALSTMTANAQAVDSTGLDRLSGVSTRVANLIPSAIPGPAGATGATGTAGTTGATGATGATGGSQPGSLCGVATGTYPDGKGRSASWNTISSCQGYRVMYNVGWQYSYEECPPGYVIATISTFGENTFYGSDTNLGNWIVYTRSCLKT